jgi:hypothetical protein
MDSWSTGFFGYMLFANEVYFKSINCKAWQLLRCILGVLDSLGICLLAIVSCTDLRNIFEINKIRVVNVYLF